MCTAITVQSPGGGVWFGRTMDFSYRLEPGFYQVSRNYRWTNLCGTHTIQNRYGFLGIGQDINPVIFVDGVNEAGFAAAALYFPGYASYDAADSGNSSALSIAAIELVGFLLGQCGSVRQAVGILKSVQIVGVEDSVTNSIAPLHWIIADQEGGCVVVEKTADGLHLWNNPVGVLTNSPDFMWHLSNLRGYAGVMPKQPERANWGGLELTPFGQGAGTVGLPGDYTPPGRFVRTAFLKSFAEIPEDKECGAAACFQILGNVTIPKGAVVTARDVPDYTQYTAVVDLREKEYFLRRGDGLAVERVTGDWDGGGSGVVRIGE